MVNGVEKRPHRSVLGFNRDCPQWVEADERLNLFSSLLPVFYAEIGREPAGG
jgi:hypothetical protein